jgi:biopolymer transport protein TolQ
MDLNVFTLVYQASWPVQAVIALMVMASVLSWGAIAFKLREFGGAERDTEEFLAAYQQGTFEDTEKAAREHPSSPLSAVTLAGVGELKRIARYRARGDESFDASQLRAVNKAINWAGSQEALRLERRLAFLATVGSATPFVGLFGTVIGIINAFAQIGMTGNAGLETVGPGIAEALSRPRSACSRRSRRHLLQRVRRAAARPDGGDRAVHGGTARRHRASVWERGPHGGPARAGALSDGRAGNRQDASADGRDQRHALRRRDARAADHLHGHRADDAAGARVDPRTRTRSFRTRRAAGDYGEAGGDPSAESRPSLDGSRRSSTRSSMATRAARCSCAQTSGFPTAPSRE